MATVTFSNPDPIGDFEKKVKSKKNTNPYSKTTPTYDDGKYIGNLTQEEIRDYQETKQTKNKRSNTRTKFKASGGRVTLKEGTENPLKAKIDSLKKKNLLTSKGKLKTPEDSEIKKRLKKLKENDLNTLPRGLKMDTTTGPYNFAKGGRVTGGRVAKGCGAVMPNRRKKTKYF
jgi:hypothetical protein